MSDKIGVVIDTGSQNSKVGFAGESSPRCVFPTTVARFRQQGILDALPEVYFGKEAIKRRGISTLTWPIQNGMICDWDEMEKLWHHIFYTEMHVAPENAGAVIAIHPLTGKSDKERIAEVLFETFLLQDLYLALSPALVLHASGRTSGVVWENGASCSYSISVFEGFPLRHSTVNSVINGNMLREHLQRLFTKVGYSFSTPLELDILDKIKKEVCYVARDYDIECAQSNSSGENKTSYALPDGQTILIRDERYQCPELLFKPHLYGYNCSNIVDNIRLTISRSELDYKTLFYNNIVLSGGSSMFKGISDRLLLELMKRGSDSVEMKPNVDALNFRDIAPWVGGSILANLSSYQNFWMTRQDYESDGVDRVNYKFF
ncbi:uncharacterized protein LOC126979068 [Leptidea sinapis]|uniref:uncharacterized protein LOC126979068 n=1 Tax=Leptidea sinapis TaxID=189913 RepID=UPI002134B7AC|nr:uncharacterized protein LOC126979068 [Leptidea sinapis]